MSIFFPIESVAIELMGTWSECVVCQDVIERTGYTAKGKVLLRGEEVT